MDRYLISNETFDYQLPDFECFYLENKPGESQGELSELIHFYYLIRDKIYYEIFGVDTSVNGLKASVSSQNGKGFCLQKNHSVCRNRTLFRLSLSFKVRSCKKHLASGDVLELMEGSVFLHWITEIKINNTRISSTPVFSKLYCMIFNQIPLEFDGKSDSVH